MDRSGLALPHSDCTNDTQQNTFHLLRSDLNPSLSLLLVRALDVRDLDSVDLPARQASLFAVSLHADQYSCDSVSQETILQAETD